jgi:hypothetical protein
MGPRAGGLVKLTFIQVLLALPLFVMLH